MVAVGLVALSQRRSSAMSKHIQENSQLKQLSQKEATDFLNLAGSGDSLAKLHEGEELWYRAWVFFPNGFDFNCNCSEGVKFMRVATKSSSGAHEGYQNFFISNNKMVIASSVNLKIFYTNNPVGTIRSIGEQITTGRWHAYELYIKFSGVPGKGIFRAWQDGNLIFEDKRTATMNSTTSYADFVWIFTYWNNKAPRTQSAYIDDVVITNQRPNNVDSRGNPYIGVGSTTYQAPTNTYQAPPNPPSIN